MFTYMIGIPASERLAALKAAIDEEVNSVGAALRNTFMNRIPTPEDIKQTCSALASKLTQDENSQIECKLALVDLLDEALHGKYKLDQRFPFCHHSHYVRISRFY